MAKLIVMVLDDRDKLPDVLAAWQEAGVPGITILPSFGIGRISKSGLLDDLPLFVSLHSLLARQEIHHNTLFAVVGDDVDVDTLFDATEAVVGPLTQPHTGIIMVLPVTEVRGADKTSRWKDDTPDRG
jgi:nitrogen regulatory protein PII